MIDKLKSFFARLEKEEFFGTIEVQMNKGEIVFVRQIKSIKPSDLK